MNIKKRNKRFLLGLIIIIVLGVILYGLFYSKSNNDVVRLSLAEKKWIENNKNKVIDIAVLNNLPLFGSEGKGIYFTFMQDFESDTNLTFNKISYDINEERPSSQYTFRILNSNAKLGSNDLLFYEDNYVIVGKQNKKISDPSSLGVTSIGVLNEDMGVVSTYLNTTNNISYTPVDNIDSLFTMLDTDRFNYVIVPKNIYLDTILRRDYYINYMFSSLSKKYVLTLDKNNELLNSIIRKNYNVWIHNYLDNSYNEEMFDLYCLIKNISDKNKATFESKRYVYGYVANLPYEASKHNAFIGISSQFIDSFAKFANVEFNYREYNNVTDLNKDLKNGKIDIAFNYYRFSGLDNKLYYTIEPLYGDYVILAHITNNIAIDSLKGLKNKTLSVLDNTRLASYANDNLDTNINKVKNIKALSKMKQNLLLVDYNTYNYYKNTLLRKYDIVYKDKMNINYNYIITKSDDNELFYNIFQYYLSSINHDQYRNAGLNKMLIDDSKIDLSLLWVYVILIPILIIILIIVSIKRKQLKRLRSDDKVKFIDPLTSLKNRYYLSHHMAEWEENTIYPQTIMIIDLNNLKDVNDSYGHEEGDRLIKTAANILINNQLEKTDIIRTDGNEFLIYMVGHDENQVIAYMRKLYRLLRELPYEYGASLGYSMIEDDIKSIDDAINEAILDMITNKETRKETE